jgi:gas vesicle protein
MNDLVKGTLLLAGGIVIGAAAALLFAPQTGDETRKQIIDLAEEAKKRTADYCEKVKKDITAAIEEARAEEKPAEA